MKKFLSVALLLVLMLTLALTGCAKKQVQSIEITEGFKYEYEVGETPDFSGVKANIIYNDGTTKAVEASELTFGTLDTTTSGKKDVTVSYGTFSTKFQVTVKSKAIGSKNVESIKYLSGIPAKVFVGDQLNFDAISILVKYDDGSEETKTVASNSAIKHNGEGISTAAAGKQTLKLTFMGKSVDVEFDVIAIVVERLEISDVNLDIVDGTAFDPTGMKVNAVFNNGRKILVSLDDEGLSITQDGDKVTVSYGGVSSVIDLNVKDPTVASLILNTVDFNDVVLVGETVSTASIMITGNLNNGLSKVLDHTEVTFGAIDTTEEGVKTITVTYNADTAVTATVTVTVIGIKKIVIDAGTVDTFIPAGTEFNYTGAQVIITANDASETVFKKGISDGVTIDVSKLNTAVINDESYITASYMGYTSDALNIVVHDPDISYSIIDVDLPKSISAQGGKKEKFLNKDYPYVVGDDNAFIFRLSLTILNEQGDLVEGFERYTGYSEIYYEGAALTGADLDTYVAIDEANNAFDFTEAAIGKTFTIKTRPANGIADSDIAAMTREVTVTVVDGLNIYEAWELNYMTNYNDSDAPNMENRTQYVDAFLNTKGVTRPASLAGIVLHNDLTIQREDVPAEYFVDGKRSNDFYDYISVFAHATDDTNPTFTFHGNYFSIYSYNLPNVCANGTGNQSDGVSSGQVFRFTCHNRGADVDHTKYTTNIQNVYLRDDNPNNNNMATADRDMRGLIAMKVQWQVANVENIRVEAYYISFYVDTDRSVANLNQCILYNAYQSHIYSYNANQLQAPDEAPSANHQPVTINITNSKITKCGGPVILNQTEDPDHLANSKSGAQVTIDDNTEIWTWVTGTEAWFKANGAEGIATQIQGLGLLLAQSGMPKTFVRTTGETGVPSEAGHHFMNMIMINIVSGTNVTEILGFQGDLDAKLVVGDKTYIDMNDTVALDGVHGYGNQTVATQFLTQAGAGKTPIILNTHTGGTLVVDDGIDENGKQNTPSATPVEKTECLGDGDYVALYYGCFGFVFGYAPYN